MLRNSFILSILILLITGAFASENSRESHSFSVHDMLAMDRISDPKVSPDGQWQIVWDHYK